MRAQPFTENLAGAWQLMRGNRAGLQRLDVSLEGFWRSFALLIAVAPLAWLGFLSHSELMDVEGTASRSLGSIVFGAESVALLADWITFPIVFAFIARPFGLGARYVPFIIARNWAALIVAAVAALIHLAHIGGLLPSSVAPTVLFVLFALALRFFYSLVRTTLDVSMSLALPIVLLDFLISSTIWAVTDRIS